VGEGNPDGEVEDAGGGGSADAVDSHPAKRHRGERAVAAAGATNNRGALRKEAGRQLKLELCRLLDNAVAELSAREQRKCLS
jgi:hypothetical protein